MPDASGFDPLGGTTPDMTGASLLAPNLVGADGTIDPQAIQRQRTQGMLLGALSGLADQPYASRLPIGWGQTLGAAARGAMQGGMATDQNLRSNLLFGPQFSNIAADAALKRLTLRGYQDLQSQPLLLGGNGQGGSSTGASSQLLGNPSGTPSSAATPPAGNTTAAPLNAPSLPSSKMPSYADATIQGESGGNANAKNANSTATGPGQFINTTWAELYPKYVAPLGLPNDPTNPQSARAAVEGYAQDNAPQLAKAGYAPSNSALGMAHNFGAMGAVRMLDANPDRPATDFASPQVVAANPNTFYRNGQNVTAGELKSTFDKRYQGTQPFSAGADNAGAVGNSGAAPAASSGSPALLGNPSQGNVAPQGGPLLGNPSAGNGQPAPLLGNVPQTGNPGAGQQSFVDPRYALAMAQRYSRIPGMQGIAQQYLSLAEKGLPTGYRIGMDGNYYVDPGYYQGETALAGGKKAAELPFTSSTIRPGGVQTIGGAPVYQAPIGIPGVTPSGAPTTQFVTPAMPGGNQSSPQANGGANNGTLPPNTYVTGLDPLTHASLEKRGTELENYGQGLQDSASSAVNSQFLIDQMRRESGNGSGWVPGRFADWGGELRSVFNGVLPNASDSVNSALANFQSFQKNSMQLLTQATRAVSPRAAVQEMQMIREALPGSQLSSGGLSYIFDQLSANNDFSRAKAQSAEAWRPLHNGTLAGFDSDWNQNVSPFAFLVKRMSAPDFQTMSQNLGQTAQGCALVSRMMAEMQYAQKNGLWQDTAAQ